MVPFEEEFYTLAVLSQHSSGTSLENDKRRSLHEQLVRYLHLWKKTSSSLFMRNLYVIYIFGKRQAAVSS